METLQTQTSTQVPKGLMTTMTVEREESKKDKIEKLEQTVSLIPKMKKKENIEMALLLCSGHIEALCKYDKEEDVYRRFNQIIDAYNQKLFSNPKELGNQLNVYLRKHISQPTHKTPTYQ